MNCKLLVLIIVVYFSSWNSLLARPDFLDAWNEVYPDVRASELGCQLCHASRDGGDGWNGYGFDIRSTFIEVFARADINASIEFVENLNSDQDSLNFSNVSEIRRGLYPGWVDESLNTVFFKDGTFLLNQNSPDQERVFVEEQEVCFTIISKKKRTALICL
ncbi:hypothetical protein NBRC116583_14620 [Arenicella sp. 4NH20-0111]|uniref:hypothetical protein n=1 Tax=Arenicella sp. 4NH20-0111 TaxID=3127648 RepID=UPI00310BD425